MGKGEKERAHMITVRVRVPRAQKGKDQNARVDQTFFLGSLTFPSRFDVVIFQEITEYRVSASNGRGNHLV